MAAELDVVRRGVAEVDGGHGREHVGEPVDDGHLGVVAEPAGDRGDPPGSQVVPEVEHAESGPVAAPGPDHEVSVGDGPGAGFVSHKHSDLDRHPTMENRLRHRSRQFLVKRTMR
jgi:hypothetical protein